MSVFAPHLPTVRFAGSVLNGLDVFVQLDEDEQQVVWAEITASAFNGAPDQRHRVADVSTAIKIAGDIAAAEGRNVCVMLGDLIWQVSWGATPLSEYTI